MKQIMLFSLLIWISHVALSQTWSANGSSLYYNGGNVGVGTSSPSCLLHVSGGNAAAAKSDMSGFTQLWADNAFIWKYGSSYNGLRLGTATTLTATNWNEVMRIMDNGNVGIGTTAPQELLHVSSSVQYPRVIVQSTNANGFPGFAIADNTGTEKWTWHYSIPNGFSGFFLAGVGNVMALTNSGTVGINTTDTKGYTFAVNGTAVFTTVTVKPYANWPDYVFDKGYRLPSLDSVSAFIQEHHHLPGVESGDSVLAKGIDLGQTQAAVLKKVEELTLYLIEQKKINEQQNELLKKQQDRINRLELLISQTGRRKGPPLRQITLDH